MAAYVCTFKQQMARSVLCSLALITGGSLTYTSFDTKKPSPFNIQAVEDSEVVAIDKQTMDRLFNLIPSLERYFRIILQCAFSASVMRMHYIFDQSAEERYQHFNTSYPDFVQR